MRFHPDAAARLRASIQEVGGDEVFAVGDVGPDRQVRAVEVHCRGTADAVLALRGRARPGQVVIHNHPSGDLRPSEPDVELAHRFGEDGVGFIIVDNEVRRERWVVEPLAREPRPVDLDAVRAFFERDLPRALPGHEARPGQLEMALTVADALNRGQVAALEAGTGTGKSLAYLVPSALWALANEGRVLIATHTITLQGQLAGSDLPTLAHGGLEVRHAVVKGRSNYACRRRLAEAVEALEPDDPGARLLRDVAAWAETAMEGTRHDLAFPVDDDLWDEIRSDHDQTLRARCPHYDTCFYYNARRRAADAHLLVVNHALLLADLVVKAESGGEGVLPVFDRVVLDEAHHLEEAATGLLRAEVTATALRRAVAPLLKARRKAPPLERLGQRFGGGDSPLAADERESLKRKIAALQHELPRVADRARGWMEQLVAAALGPYAPTLRITAEVQAGEVWAESLLPPLQEAAAAIGKVAHQLGQVEHLLESIPPGPRMAEPQPVFALKRARRLLDEKARLLSDVAKGDERDGAPWVRWLEAARGAGPREAAVCAAPLDVGPLLRERLFGPMKASVLTSATLTVAGRFDHFLGRIGLGPTGLPGPVAPPDEEHLHWDEPQDVPVVPAGGFTEVRRALYDSPFDYGRQALLLLPRDLPPTDTPAWEDHVARATAAALHVSGGGAFVLCTSFRQLELLHARAREVLGDRLLLLRQGEMGRNRLLERFRAHGDAVLFGADTFWEGVSVAGAALRLLVIPRLPFRVPTEPVLQARHEQIEAMGGDAFRHYALPQAILRMRQGVGRLVRTTTDRGAVLVLDRRLHERWYGRTFVASLPPMARAVGPTRELLMRLRAFYRDAGGDPADLSGAGLLPGGLGANPPGVAAPARGSEPA